MALPYRDFERQMKAAYYRQNIRPLIPILAWLVPLIAFTIFFFANPTHRPYGDLDNAKTQEGTGVIVRITPPHTNNDGDIYPSLVRVRVAGQEADMEYRVPVRVGDRVRVTYKVGKSGQVYIAHLGSPDL